MEQALGDPTPPWSSPGSGLPALRKPYLLFLADIDSAPFAKTAFGIRDWAPESSLAQWRLPGCGVDLSLPELTPESAVAAGAGSLVIGVATAGGQIPALWQPHLLRAVDAGLDVVSGMHVALAQVPGLADAARRHGVALIDVRHPRQEFPVGTGRRRTGKRLLTVGTDCALGKKYTALALTRAMRARGIDADFRATGQTGIMISGSGVAIDAVVADFAAGAAEWLSPDAPADHWDVIEGQGSLFHPSYAGVTVSLVHGSQPDVLILCHDPQLTHIKSCPEFALPTLRVAARRYLELATLTNPGVRLAGVSLDTSRLDAAARARVICDTEREISAPCFDPLQTSLDTVLD
ncbi:MAG: DUF1611 domain-containing protein, partial [Steroidobacteraceae bacterium]